MESGVLFSIDDKYHVTVEKVADFDTHTLAESQYFIPEKDIQDNPNGFIRDGEQILIARLRRQKVIEDLAKLGLLPGCKPPEYAYYVVYGQPNVRNTPSSLYYEIEQTFGDMGWEYTGCPHNND
jgi:hypothetical protein